MYVCFYQLFVFKTRHRMKPTSMKLNDADWSL